MKIFFKMILLVSGFVLIGCGGGGNTASPTIIVYEGKTTKAVLNEESSKLFLELIQNSFSNIESGKGTLSYKTSIKMTNKIAKLSPIKTEKILDNQTVQGQISGTLRVTIEETGSNTGRYIYVYTNYSNEVNLVINGTIIEALTVSETGRVEKVITTYKMFTVDEGVDSVTLDGQIIAEKTSAGSKTTENYILKNNQTNEMIKYENFVTLYNHSSQILSQTGKVYDSNYGYVNVSTVTQLAYNDDGSRKAEGEVLLEGETSSATLKYAYEGRVRVETDFDKDGTVDHLEVYRENTSGELEVVPNSAPIIEITFPQSIYTDTDMSTVSVNIYDPDLDEFTAEYKWRVNDIVKGNGLALDNTLFVKHDILKLTVTAIDARVGDIKSNTNFKEQKVLNSAPVAILDLNTSNIGVGQSISLDASKSYDVDDDNFTYTWSTENRAYNIYDKSYNQDQLYLAFNENNMSKVLFLGEKVNYDSYEEVAAYGIHLILDDGDTDGISNKYSADIIVNVMDLFNKELIILKDQNIFTDAITAISMGDLNNDGLKDVVVATDTYGDYVDNGKLIIFLQNSEHKFQITKKITLEDISPYSYNSITIADLNHDGLEDIAYTSPTMKGFNVYYQNIDSEFIEEKTYVTKSFAHIPFPTEPNMVDYISNSVNYLSSSDINRDGKKDVVTIGSNTMTSGSTGMDIFLQYDNNLNDNQILVLDNRTIENDGDYEVTDSHKISDIHIEDIDKDGLKDFVVANYIQYQESNGTFSEKLYEGLDYIASIGLDENTSTLIGINTFDKNLFIYNQMNNSNRDYQTNRTLDIIAENPNQVYGAYIRDRYKSDVVVGHNTWPYFTLFAQKENGFYGDQLYKLNDKLGVTYTEKNIIIDDINNDNKDDILLLGRRGFEVYYTK